MERKRLLKPEKTRIVGKGSDHERLQEYRPPQQARKRKVELNIRKYNRFFHHFETLGTTPLKEYQQNNHESWIIQNLSDNESQVSNIRQKKCPTGTTPLKEYQQNNHESWIIQNLSDNESQVSNIRQEKCPTNALKKFREHETVNLIRLKQTVKTNTMDDDHNEHTEETIKRAEKDFALDLPMLVDETEENVRILSAIAALEKNQPEDIFYPYRPHKSNLTTRFGLLFYNDNIVIPEAMRTTIIALLYQGHLSATKMEQSAQRSGGPVFIKKYERKRKTAPAAEAQVKTS